MNIQIFGTAKNFDVKKAERYFRERKIPYQFVDMKEKDSAKANFARFVRLSADTKNLWMRLVRIRTF